MIKARLMTISVYKDIINTPVVQALLRFTQAHTPDDLICAYTDFIHQVWRSGHKTLSDVLAWHLKFDESMIGTAIASGTADQRITDAAAMDIRRLSAISRMTCASMKSGMFAACVKVDENYGPLIQNLPELEDGNGFDEEEIFDSYRMNGCGKFALGRAFHWEKGSLTPVKNIDPLTADEMIGYELQRQSVIDNTRTLIEGHLANNVLLYGDSGTGKSATIKALLHIPEFYNLRLIELAKNSLGELPEILRIVSQHTQKFILYIDDLSFEQEDKDFSVLKTALEGGLERRPDNVVIYATSNRRHMIRESFSDRAGDEVHVRETMEERTSLSERFGIRLAYLALDKKKYTDMVVTMCHALNLPYDDGYLAVQANQWELRHGGRTPRVAKQLVDKLAGEAGK